MELQIIIGILAGGAAIASFFLGRISSAKTDGKQDGQILTELGYLKSSTDEIKTRLNDQDKKSMDIIIAVANLEKDMKTAFARIDELRGHIKE